MFSYADGETIARRVAGDVIGEMFILTRNPRVASLVAARDLDPHVEDDSLLAVRFDTATLDAIDELVPPGTIVDEEDRGFDLWRFEPNPDAASVADRNRTRTGTGRSRPARSCRRTSR